jgi:hypothetical protein
MKQEMNLATAENIVTAICVGVGAVLVILALHTLSTVSSVNASNSYGYGDHGSLASFDNALQSKAGTYSSEISEEKGIPGRVN